MSDTTLGQNFLKELEAESAATRKCLERIPENLFEYKPHEKSMKLGYLALLVAEIPRWITVMVEDSVIDFATFKHIEPKNTAELVEFFDKNMENVRTTLGKVSDAELDETFYLKNNGETLYSSPKNENISSTINHLVHHRGQLTVYMRLNDIDVPSIYGPSADEKGF